MTRRLPRRIQSLVDLIGWSQTLRLLNAKGGTALYFPRDPNSAGALSYVVNRPALERLCAEFGGLDTAVRLPKPDKMLLEMRDSEIIAAHRAGKRVSTLATEYGLTDRRIQSIVKQQTTTG